MAYLKFLEIKIILEGLTQNGHQPKFRCQKFGCKKLRQGVKISRTLQKNAIYEVSNIILILTLFSVNFSIFGTTKYFQNK